MGMVQDIICGLTLAMVMTAGTEAMKPSHARQLPGQLFEAVLLNLVISMELEFNTRLDLMYIISESNYLNINAV